MLYGSGTAVRLPEGTRGFLKRLDQTDSVAHSPSYAVAARALVPWVKGRGCEDEYWPVSNAEVKNTWRCTSTHHTPSRCARGQVNVLTRW